MEFAQYISKRVQIFDRIKAQQEKKESEKIKIKTVHGEYSGMSYETTPFIVSKELNPNHKELLVARVNQELFDVHRPLEKDSVVEFLTFADEDGKKVFWHSSAHILGEACENTFSCHLCLGPPTESGFFYEMDMDRAVTPEDYKPLKKEMKKILKENQRFERLVMTKSELLEMFADNPLKVELIQDKVQDKSTVYRCGPLIDFCLGPHIPSTGLVKAIEVLHNSSSFFLGDSNRPVLQRIYGISFPSKEEMTQHLAFLEEAKKNNHRKIGSDLDLFFFSPMSPGSCFFLPKGAFVYNALMTLMREHYKKKDFKEVITPNIYTNELWKTSGHLEKYKEDMFCFQADNTEMALKPMNCPGHCLLFKHLSCSYRDLPLRLADFGVLHRNEVSGALTGLTRVRRFQQDDAHIFLSPDMVAQEIQMCLDFLEEVYSLLGFEYSVCLSTRPEKYIGRPEIWDGAEEQLKQALESSGVNWSINPGDGAFYGPKIDISVRDALGRKHQCGTIQLDFQLPERFNLKFASNEGDSIRPVMIHRAILGSVERMTGILLEHYKGRLPPWLNPNQVMIIPITSDEAEYANEVKQELHAMEVSVDLSECTLNKKILNAEKVRYSYIIIVGKKEAQRKQLSVRNLKDGKTVVLPLSQAHRMISETIRRRLPQPADGLKYATKETGSTLPVHLSQALVCLEKIVSSIKEKFIETFKIKRV